MAGRKKQPELTAEEKLQQALVPEAEQPYKVPDNWCWTYSPFIFEVQYGNGLTLKDLKEDGYPVFGANGQIGYYDDFMYEDIKAMMSCRGAYSGTMNLSLPKSFITSNSLIIDAKDDNITAKFIYYLFSALNKKSLVSGSAQPQVTVQAFNKFRIPLPPLAEQQRIVERIETLFAKLDEAKEKLQNTLDTFETRKAAILHKAFTGELTANWRKHHGLTMDSWEEKTLQDVCSMKITDGTHKTPTYCDAEIGVPFLSAKDITSGKICWDNIKYITQELHEELYTRLQPQVDDILLAKNGTTGVAAIVDAEKIFDIYVTLAVLRPNQYIINPRYLLNIVNSSVCKNQFDEHLTGIGVPNLHLRDIKQVTISVPTIDEQTEIVRIIDNLLAKEQQAHSIAQNAIAKIDLIKKSILARAFRGQLATNNPADEPAIELLKKVL